MNIQNHIQTKSDTEKKYQSKNIPNVAVMNNLSNGMFYITGNKRPIKLEPIEEGKLKATYVPTEEGKCKIDVKYANQDVPGR